MSRLISVATRWLWSTNDAVIAVETSVVHSAVMATADLSSE
jgi:hypothetical protein